MDAATITGNMELLKSDTFRKAGATKQDIAKIAQLEAAGKTSAEISFAVNVREDIVQNFMQPVLPVMPMEEIEDPSAPVMEMEAEFAHDKRVIKEKQKKR
jgi:hypothetical protein